MSSSKPSECADVPERLFRELQRRVRSVAETRAAWLRAGLAPQTVAHALASARVRGLLNDGACARLWAGTWARQGYAWAVIRRRLLDKGLDDAAVAEAESAIGGPSADGDRARAFLKRQSRRKTPQALGRLLLARGFEADVMDSLLASRTSANDPWSPDEADPGAHPRGA
jgi:SOS response regulatory protein OraA/RecX